MWASAGKADYLLAVVQHDTRSRTLKLLRTGSPTERQLQEAEFAVRDAKTRLFTAQQALLNFGLPLHGDEESLADEQLEQRLRFLGIPAEIVGLLQTDTATANLLPLIAPRSGTVIELGASRPAKPCPSCMCSRCSSSLTLTTFTPTWTSWPEDVARVAVGMEAAFKPDSDDHVAVGPLEFIATAVDDKTRLVHAHVHLHNQDGRLRANLFGTATVTVANARREAGLRNAGLRRAVGRLR